MGSSCFNIDFDIKDYKDILPDPHAYLKNDFIINSDEFTKGDIENCYWKKQVPSKIEIQSPEFREREARRILKTGVWVAIKEELIWIPPNYYFALNYGKAGSSDMEFRLKRLKHVFFKIRARNNPGCLGTLTLKSRGDGETTMSTTDGFWECLDGNMETGQLGIQSKTRQEGKAPCWFYVQTLWQSLPQWLKDVLCSDFISGDSIAESMKFMRSSDEERNIKARNIVYKYYPSGTPMDGLHDLKKCILDEICKWEETSTFYPVFVNYLKFIMPGFERRGMFDMFSSPADKNCQSNAEVFQLWQDSNSDEITETGTTKSRIHRYHSNPLDGIAGSYDKFGDVDPQRIYDKIMADRKAKPKDMLLAEIRGYPLNEQEMFEMAEGGDFWSNSKGIAARKIYLLGTRFKSQVTQEPKVVYGNLEWKDGIKDNVPIFRMADVESFDVNDARFCFSYMPDNDEQPLNNIFHPPNYIENCLGIDSVDKRYPGKRPSDFAMVNNKFRDAKGTGIVNCPTMIYCNRPLPIEISYEDAIKAAVFNRSLVQVESLNTKVVDYFEDRGYLNWMLSKIGQPKNSLVKGDAPSGKNTSFINEIVGMLDAATNVPVNADDPYKLELNWFYELLDDLSKFNMKDTHASDKSMAWGQSILGSAKIMFKKQKQKSVYSNKLFQHLFD